MQARLGILIHSQMLRNNKNRLFIKDKIYFCTIKKIWIYLLAELK